MLLTGSFREYPFSLLLEIFLRRRETGLLEVSSPEQSGYFYIKNGKVKDGQIGTSRGAAAVKLVGRFVDGSFRFKPLEPTDYAQVVWQLNFGPNALATNPTFIPVATAISKFGHLRSYPAAAYRLPERTLAPLAHGVLRQSQLFAPAVYRSLEKTAQTVQQRIVAWTTAAFAFCTNAYLGTRRLTIFATMGNEFRTFRSKSTAFYHVSEQALASGTPRFFRQLELAAAKAYQGLNHTTSRMGQRGLACTTAALALWKSAEVGTRSLRLTKRGLTAWQSAMRRDKRRILAYVRQFEFSPLIPGGAAILESLKHPLQNNATFALLICVLGLIGALCLYQIVFVNLNAMEPGVTVDKNFETEVSPAPTPQKRKPQRRKRSIDKKSVRPLQVPGESNRE